MKNTKFFFILLIAGLLVYLNPAFSQSVYNFDEGLAKAKSLNKKVLINIYIEPDTWCSKMESVYSNEVVKSLINADYIYVKLNGQGTEKYNYNGKQITASELAKQFGVNGYPTHVFLNPDGSLIKFKYNGDLTSSFPGFVEAGDFEKILKYFANNQFKDTDLSKVF